MHYLLIFMLVSGADILMLLMPMLMQVADRLASDHHPGQVVVVCGTNEKTKEALEAHPWPGQGSGVNVRVLGFVSNMDEWMSASDIMVTKVWWRSMERSIDDWLSMGWVGWDVG